MDSSNSLESNLRVAEHDVWEVANTLWAKKIDPSANKIRELLGNRGSFRTIQMYLDSWRKQEWDAPSPNDPLWQELTKIRKKCEQQVITAASKKIQEVQEECGHKIIEAQLIQQTTKLECEDLTNQLHKLQQDSEKLTQEQKLLNNMLKEEEKKRYEAELTNKHFEKDMLEHKRHAKEKHDVLSQEYEQKITILQEEVAKIEQNSKLAIAKLNEEHKQYQQISQEKIFSLQNNCLEHEKKIHVLEHSKKSYQEKLITSENLLKDAVEKLHKLEDENEDLLKQQHIGEIKQAALEAQFQQLEKINIEQKLQLQEVQSALLVQKERSGKLEEKLQQLHIKEKKSYENKKNK